MLCGTTSLYRTSAHAPGLRTLFVEAPSCHAPRTHGYLPCAPCAAPGRIACRAAWRLGGLAAWRLAFASFASFVCRIVSGFRYAGGIRQLLRGELHQHDRGAEQQFNLTNVRARAHLALARSKYSCLRAEAHPWPALSELGPASHSSPQGGSTMYDSSDWRHCKTGDTERQLPGGERAEKSGG
jgi:hypothetical protein